MSVSTPHYSTYLSAIQTLITNHADEIASLDQAIGDGDHLINLQRGLTALLNEAETLDSLDLPTAFTQTGMTLMSTMGGASGSLLGSMFISMGKTAKQKTIDLQSISDIFNAGVESIKARGKADVGEKTMLDTLIPAASKLTETAQAGETVETCLNAMNQAAEEGMQSTKDMLATKGRASFLGERARGHIDAGARTSQLILLAIADVVLSQKN